MSQKRPFLRHFERNMKAILGILLIFIISSLCLSQDCEQISPKAKETTHWVGNLEIVEIEKKSYQRLQGVVKNLMETIRWCFSYRTPVLLMIRGKVDIRRVLWELESHAVHIKCEFFRSYLYGVDFPGHNVREPIISKWIRHCVMSVSELIG